MKKLLTVIFCCVSLMATAQVRQETDLRTWQFSRDGATWQTVSVPHDWAIYGPFDKKWDLQNVAIRENHERRKSEKSGRSGALPWIGKGTYTTTFTTPKGYRHVELSFDGAMSEPVVYVNGHEAGRWAYGYNAFRVDATPWLNAAGKTNEVRVELNNLEESSRWYPGGGIYRPVKLICTGKNFIDPWQLFVRLSSLKGTTAQVAYTLHTAKGLEAEVTIVDAQGRKVATKRQKPNAAGDVDIILTVPNAHLWSPEIPYLYKAVTKLYRKKKLVDQLTTNVGLRTVEINKERGFVLNGLQRKIKGVCLHHDLGPLGAAVNKAALIRQIRLLKEMGCDAIRTAHNMPSQMQMDVCDSMGMMVMAETFDCWREPKVKNGYNRFWREWWQRDVERLIRGHRNHPSIVMWSVGNEIPEQDKPEGVAMLDSLVQLCHHLDPTRLTTSGVNLPERAIKTGFFDKMDVPGFNYHVNRYDEILPQLKQGFLLGSETASTVSSRGEYFFPAEQTMRVDHENGQCSGYDLERQIWSNLPDDDWQHQEDDPRVIGEFVWSGFDYLGEPTPYDKYWPSRSSYFGMFDLAGLPKDRYYLYRSRWRQDEPTIHLLPHWTWPGREGEVTPVYCYTNYPTAELFVNGKSQGHISKQKDSYLDRFRLRWNNVVYEPGELRVVVYDDQGNAVGEQTVRTAGAEAQLRLTADRTTLHANGDDLAFITVDMLDRDGTLCPVASDELLFTVEGAGTYRAACNGDATSLEQFHKPQMKLFHGQLVVIVQATNEPGPMTLTVRNAQGTIQKSITINSIKQ